MENKSELREKVHQGAKLFTMLSGLVLIGGAINFALPQHIVEPNTLCLSSGLLTVISLTITGMTMPPISNYKDIRREGSPGEAHRDNYYN